MAIILMGNFLSGRQMSSPDLHPLQRHRWLLEEMPRQHGEDHGQRQRGGQQVKRMSAQLIKDRNKRLLDRESVQIHSI